MTKTLIKTTPKVLIALTAAATMALPASQAAAGTSKTESALIGALIGGLGGAAVGNGKTESVVIGAAAGAALGVAVDKSNDRKSYRSGAYRYRQQAAPAYYRDSRYNRVQYDRYGRAYYDNSRYDSRYYDAYGYRR
jgi:uncharacterized protein YcfJ